MIKFARHPEKYPLEYRFKVAQKEIKMALKHLKVEYKFKNMEMLNGLKENALVISNHLSDADPLILIAQSEKPLTFVAKEEVFKFPFVGKVAKALEVHSLSRSNLMAQVRQINNVVESLKDPNKPSCIIYIEGHRNRHPENPCLDFHPGTLKIAKSAGVPILTVATYGTHRVLAKNSCLNPVLTQFKCLKLYSKEEVSKIDTAKFAVELKQIMDKEVDELRKVDLEYLNNLKISNKKRELESLCDIRVKS